MNQLQLEDFPVRSFDKLRYADTDRQGHVNNAVFSTFLETGRVEFLYQAQIPILSGGNSFVIASLQLNFLREINWPGQVDIGTGILKVGNSSITFCQQIFQNEKCAATAETVIVQVDDESGRSKPLSEQAKQILGKWILSFEE
jgi:acyl-CoA thioester hydrolase